MYDAIEKQTRIAEDPSASHDVQSRPQRYRMRRIASDIARYLVLLLFAAIFLAPFILIFFWAFRTEVEIGQNPFALPIPFHFENLANVWTVGRYSVYLPNTILYSAVITVGVCLLSCMAGYALAKIPFPGNRAVLMLFLIGIMLPFFSVMIPIYLVLRDVQILGTRWALIIPGIALALPFGVFLMRSFFKALPNEISEAAKIDGCNEWGVFWKVMLPLAGPGVTSLAVFQWIWTWNVFEEALIFVQRDSLRPVGLAILFFQDRYTLDRGMVATGVVLTILPVIVIYLLLQRRFIEGVTAGALKN